MKFFHLIRTLRFVSILTLLLYFLLGQVFSQGNIAKQFFDWQQTDELPAFGEQETPLGVAGPIAGIHNGVMIIAGGANFDQPYWENDKVWHDDIWVRVDDDWLKTGNLSHPLAYGAVVSTDLGVIAMGGSDGRKVYDEVLLLAWDIENKTVTQELLPPLPKPCAYGNAVILGEVIYLAGGTEEEGLASAMKNFWRLDLTQYGSSGFSWEVLPAWPGPERAFNMIAAQHNGKESCIYVMGGRKNNENGTDWDVLTDVYEFSPSNFESGNEDKWRKQSQMPMPRMAGTAIDVGQSHIFILSGADGSLYKQADSLREQHPGFPKQIFGYHTITDTWFEAGEMYANHVTSHTFKDGENLVLASGEIKPRIRSPKVWRISPKITATTFGWVNTGAIIIYLLLLVGIGIYFSFRTKNTDDFFRGGQRIPWWAAGCSIFATMLSSLTFMSVPAKTYATDWVYFLINMCIVALAPFIIYFVLPFFRRIDATSAYEYLENRFNLATRLFASASYILFQIGRMAIVMYLPALALAAVTPISIEMSILLMGLFSIVYAALGGIEAVIWTDTLQAFVLLGGALLSLLLIILNPEIGLSNFFSTAFENQKFKMIDEGWSYTGTALWVIILGGIGQTLIPYTSDQGVIQRYMAVDSEEKAAKSIWTNAWLSLFATVLFFTVGTALFVFYKNHPTTLDSTFQTDAVFPLFIARQLPTGIAGVVIAGIFAAAQSTVSTSMNSIATVFSTDFIRRFDLLKDEKVYLGLARILTVGFGILGTGSALLIASADIQSLWDSFMGILGLLGGAMCGLFMLGMFTKQANGKGALLGAIGGVICLWLVQQYTDVSFLLYAAIGVGATFAIGWLSSLVLKD